MVKYIKGQTLFYINSLVDINRNIYDYKIEKCIVESIDENYGVASIKNLVTDKTVRLGLEHSKYTHYYFTLEEAQLIINSIKNEK